MFQHISTHLRRTAAIATLVFVAVLSGCQTVPENSDWLYHALGERDGIAAINETLLLNIAADDRISGLFKDTDIIRLHRLLTEQFCVLAGGPCTYTGASMVETHRGLNLTSTDFNALVEDLVRAMEAHHISVPAQNRLLAQLAPMRRDVVDEHPLPPETPATSTTHGATATTAEPGYVGPAPHTRHDPNG